jgi:hypothetical protein
VAQVEQPSLDRRDVVGGTVEGDFSAGNDVLGVEKPHNLGVVDAHQPRARKGDSSPDVTSSRVSLPAPAVICVQWSDVDDHQVGVGKPPVQLVGRDRRAASVLKHLRYVHARRRLECRNHFFET